MHISRACYHCGQVALKVACAAYAPGSAVVNTLSVRCPNNRCRKWCEFTIEQKDMDETKSRAEFEAQTKKGRALPSGGKSMRIFVHNCKISVDSA